jgi:hypothetical protein
MAMGARFEATLERQKDGSIEVCGPVQFDLGDVEFDVLTFSITDGNGMTVHHLCAPPAKAVPGPPGQVVMWESAIPAPQAGRLADGNNVSGHAIGVMHLANKAILPFQWTQSGLVIADDDDDD